MSESDRGKGVEDVVLETLKTFRLQSWWIVCKEGRKRPMDAAGEETESLLG